MVVVVEGLALTDGTLADSCPVDIPALQPPLIV